MGWSISSFVESLGGEGRVGKKERTLSEGGTVHGTEFHFSRRLGLGIRRVTPTCQSIPGSSLPAPNPVQMTHHRHGVMVVQVVAWSRIDE